MGNQSSNQQIVRGKSRRNNKKRFNAFSTTDTAQHFSVKSKKLDFFDSDEDFYVDYSSEHVDKNEVTTQTLTKKVNRNSTWTKAIHGRGICHAIKDYIKNLPYNFWKSYIEALLIPRYRPEWGKYVKWDAKIRPITAEERARQKSERILRNRKLAHLNSNKRNYSNRKKRRHYSRKRYFTDRPPRPIKHDHSKCIPIRINVAGKIFEPQLRTLEQFPKTLLGNPQRMAQFYDPERDEFFFDRHRSSFESILYYYNSGGILRRPTTVAHEIFLNEVKFFDLGADIIASLQHRTDANTEDNIPLPENLLKRKLWLLFEHPESSHQSKIFAYISILAVCMSIFEFCIETLPSFEMEPDEDGYIDVLNMKDPFFFTETMCIVFFVVEYIVRAATSPHLFNFIKEITNIIDLTAIMPYFLNLIYQADSRLHTNQGQSQLENKAISLTVFRIIRLVRVFRILKLSRHNRGLKILGKTLRASGRELGLLMFFLMVGVVVFSSAMYFAESQYDNSPFRSIPAGFWFGVVTMTTLGYGDDVPVGPLGKIIGAICAIAGVLTISLPVPVIVSNFNMFYNSEEANNPQAAAAKILPDCDHVEHCPYYPAWYTRDGLVVGDKLHTPTGTEENAVKSYSARWLMGEQKPDYSDSDFDELLKDKLLKHKDDHIEENAFRTSERSVKAKKTSGRKVISNDKAKINSTTQKKK